MRDDLGEQLLGLIEARLLDPLEILLEDDQPVTALRAELRVRAASWAETIRNGPQPAAVGAVSRIVATLYPDDRAFAPPAEWWRAPLGQAVVRLIGHPFAATVSYATAGAMLGISRQGVHDLVRRGRLPRHEDGGVPVAAIRERLLSAPARPPQSPPEPGADTPQSPVPDTDPPRPPAPGTDPPRPPAGHRTMGRPLNLDADDA